MTIHLKVENYDQLPDGGPVEFATQGRSLEIGRAIERDWTLPDPRKYISGRHCEIRHVDGDYWLHDLSSNGTFLNGSSSRLTGPVKLQNGDRLQIGHYFIIVRLGNGVFESGTDPAPGAATRGSSNQLWDDGIWETGGEAPTPMNRRDFMPPKPGQAGPDFLQQQAHIPVSRPQVQSQFQPLGTGSQSPFASPGPTPQESPFPQSPAAAPDPFPSSSSSPFPNSGLPPSSEGFAPQMPAGNPPVPMPGGSNPPGAVRAGHSSYSQGGGTAELLNAIAQGAGIPVAALSSRPPAEIGREIGTILALSTEQLAQLLKGRAEAKRKIIKSPDTTMLGAEDNNPLKFIPNTTEMLEIMFMRNRQGYLDGPKSFADGFKDLQKHEVATYAAMQKALKKLVDQLDPEQIEETASSASSFGMKKSKAWDTYVERWKAKTEAYDNGMLDTFLRYFAEAYHEMTSGK